MIDWWNASCLTTSKKGNTMTRSEERTMSTHALTIYRKYCDIDGEKMLIGNSGLASG